jgi:hypothetical protein
MDGRFIGNVIARNRNDNPFATGKCDPDGMIEHPAVANHLVLLHRPKTTP